MVAKTTKKMFSCIKMHKDKVKKCKQASNEALKQHSENKIFVLLLTQILFFAKDFPEN